MVSSASPSCQTIISVLLALPILAALGNTSLRAQVDGLVNFIATTETAKHRVFQLVPANVVPDHMVITIGLDRFAFGVLSSRLHTEWALEMGGTLEDRPRYNKSVCFDPFPFPSSGLEQVQTIETLAEELDSERRAAMRNDDRLTMTGLYNFVEAVRSGTLQPEQEARASRARARSVAKLHDDLDQAVANAYGWGAEWRRAPLPPAEIVARLVALNAERVKEEADGHVRWLRPDYQEPRFGKAGKAVTE